jgi:lysyl-tRNA synthetase class 2
MAKKNERKRVAALECNPNLYSSEITDDVVDVLQLKDVALDAQVSLVGRLMLADMSGTISKLGIYSDLGFQKVIDLENTESDGSSIKTYLVRNEDNLSYLNTSIHVGDVVLLKGVKICHPDSGEIIFLAESIRLLSKALADVYDKNIDFRKRSNMYEHRHVQMLRDPTMVQAFKLYARVYKEIRKFLYSHDYDEVSMTLLQETFEAGMADSFKTYVVDRQKEMHLRLTAELMLRKLMISGFTKVFEIGKSYRNQGAVQTMHPEFTILELYRAYAKEGEMETLLQSMLQTVLISVYGEASVPTKVGTLDCSGQWKSVDFKEEISRLTGMSYDESQPVEVNALILDRMGRSRPQVLSAYTVGTELYSYLISQYREPTFLKGLPASTSPLNKQNVDGSTIDETLLIINGMLVADVVNAERDPVALRKRMEKQLEYRGDSDENPEVNEGVLEAMRYGLPPCRGIGIGMERLLMFIFNRDGLREVELFPVF